MKGDDEIFSDAHALPRAERAAFIAAACGDDGAQRARVKALLAGADQVGSFLEHGAIGPLRLAGEEAACDTIGRYVLREKLGEGGCGVVWVAEQSEPVRRRVALKIIKLGMDTREVIARFEAERQALAMMDHPNIARVFDGGATATGRPYFVMELVRGVPITRYCDEARLTLAQRVELFLEVCHAVQHAHERGIVHRDLKPSNILVAGSDGRGTPKVIDFGVAKAMQGRLTEHTVYTSLQQFIGTPAYMSPEQAELGSADVDPRSDLYSLGVLLYELFTGRTPFGDDSGCLGGDELRRRIRSEEPLRPAARLRLLPEGVRAAVARERGSKAGQLAAALKGELEWVVMRCLEKDRVRRYQSANALADDLQRYLRDEPVWVRPPGVNRWMQSVLRGRRAVWMAVVLGLTIAAAGWLMAPHDGPDRTAGPRSAAPPVHPLAGKARLLFDRWDFETRQDLLLAEELLKKALAENPADGEAWGIHALVACRFVGTNLDTTDERKAQAKAMAARALRLAPNSGTARLAWAYSLRFDPSTRDEALRLLREEAARQPENPNVHMTLAAALRQAGEFEESARCLESAVAQFPARPALRFNLAMSLAGASRWAEAEAAIDRVLEIEPAMRGAIMWKIGILLDVHGDLDAARAWLSRLPAVDDVEEGQLFQVVKVWLYSREPAKALEALRMAKDTPARWRARPPKAYWTGRAQEMAGNVQAARSDFLAGLKALEAEPAGPPDAAVLVYWRAVLLAMLGDKVQATALWREIEERARSGEPFLHGFNLARLLLLCDRQAEALARLETTMQSVAQIANGHDSVAGAHGYRIELRFDPVWDRLRGQPRFEALCRVPAAPARVSAVAEPQSREAMRLIARARALYETMDLATTEDLALAEQLLKRAMELEPQNAEAWAASAMLLSRLIFGFDEQRPERSSLALSHAARALKLDPQSEQARLAWAVSLRLDPRTKREALGLLREEIIRQPRNRIVLIQLASELRVLGHLDESLALLDRAAELATDDASVQNNRCLTLLRMGRTLEAEEAMDKALTHAPNFAKGITWKILFLLAHHRDLAGAQRQLGRFRPEDLHDEAVAVAAARVWIYSRDAARCRAALRSLPDYIARRTSVTGPKTFFTGLAHHAAGNHAAARSDWGAALKTTQQQGAGSRVAAAYWQALLLGLLGRGVEAEPLVAEIREHIHTGEPALGDFEWARLMLVLGNTPAALDALEVVAGTLPRHTPGPVFYWRQVELLFDPLWDPLRGDARFEQVVQAYSSTGAAKE